MAITRELQQSEITFPPGLEVLTADRDYYVDAGLGSDSNDGLSAGAGAFATLQKACDVIMQEIWLADYKVTVNVADGTYGGSFPAIASARLANVQGKVEFIGNTGTPDNVITDQMYYGYGWLIDNCSDVTVTGFRIKEEVAFAPGYAALAAVNNSNVTVGAMRVAGDTSPIDLAYVYSSLNHSFLELGTGTRTLANVNPLFSYFGVEVYSAGEMKGSDTIEAGETVDFGSGAPVRARTYSRMRIKPLTEGGGSTVTGRRFIASVHSRLNTTFGGATLTTMNGDNDGIVDNSSYYGSSDVSFSLDNYVNEEVLTATRSYVPVAAQDSAVPLANSRIQVLSAAAPQTITLPNANSQTPEFIFYNNGAATLTINNFPATFITTIAPGAFARFLAPNTTLDYVLV